MVKGDKTKQQKEIDDLRGRNGNLQVQIGDVNAARQKQETKISELKSENGKLQKQNENQQSAITEKDAEIAKLKAQLAEQSKSEELQGVAAQSVQIDTEEQEKLNKKITKLQKKTKELEVKLGAKEKELKDYKSKNNPQEFSRLKSENKKLKRYLEYYKQLLSNQGLTTKKFQIFSCEVIAYYDKEDKNKEHPILNPDTKFAPDPKDETVLMSIHDYILRGEEINNTTGESTPTYQKFSFLKFKCNTCEQVFPIGEYMDSQHHTTYASAVVAGLNVSVYSAGTDLQSVL